MLTCTVVAVVVFVKLFVSVDTSLTTISKYKNMSSPKIDVASQTAKCVIKCLFTALHGMQARYSDEKAVRPSVRPSVRLSNACIVTIRKKDLSSFLKIRKNI